MSCPDADDAEIIVAAAAAGPKSVTTDGMTVEQHGLKDLIAWRNHKAALCAADVPQRGLRFTRLVPPGTTE
jgi:hypothetical protein